MDSLPWSRADFATTSEAAGKNLTLLTELTARVASAVSSNIVYMLCLHNVNAQSCC